MMKKRFRKKMKKALSVLCTLTMLIGMLGVPVQAAGTHTLTITSETNGHTYQAYQVFAGNYSETGDGTKVLSNISWGSGVNGSALLDALKANTTYKDKFSSCTTAADVAKAIDGISDASFTDAFAAIVAQHLTGTPSASGDPTGSASSYTYSITGLADGYYFINEKSFGGTVDNAYTKYMLQVLDDVTVAAKTDKPAIALKVLENNDSTYKDSWNDAADYSIGDAVPYRIVGLVPDMTNFSTYDYKITDTITGSTYKDGSAKVYFVNPGEMYGVETKTGEGAGGTLLDSSKYTLTKTASGFTVEFNDLKSAGVTKDGYIVVEYTATLNSDAKINSTDNKVGNPNEVVLTYSNNPNDAAGRGETPKDEVDVYTFSLPVNKVDGKNTALAGATFAVFTNETDAKAAAQDPSKLTSALAFTGIDGAYTLGGSTQTLAGDGNGQYAINGLDQGSYYLVETAAPAGYNRLTEPVTVTVVPTYSAGDKTSAYVDGHVPGDTKDQLSAVSINGGTAVKVINQSGTTLPETGGIGTRIFTAVGLVLMTGAAVLIVIRKKNAPAK
jgi:fimbrial isopeptide formation D2 family protein/LPXTG-motif cell wall-anchored protein